MQVVRAYLRYYDEDDDDEKKKKLSERHSRVDTT